MARRSTGGGLWLVFGAVILIAVVPKGVWIGLGAMVSIALVGYLIIKHWGQRASIPKSSPSGDSYRDEPTLAELIAANQLERPVHKPVRPPLRPKGALPPQMVGQASSQPAAPSHAAPPPSKTKASGRIDLPVEADKFYVSPASSQSHAPSHAIPKAPDGFGNARWVLPGESIEVAGVSLPGGMLYVGGRLKALNGDIEPCLISSQHTVARVGNYRVRQMGYWPSYAEASPEERRAYLNWLSEGRSDPDCDIG